MIMYYQTKFCSKRISNLEDTVQNSHILIIRALAVTLTLKIANDFFLHDTPAHYDASQY